MSTCEHLVIVFDDSDVKVSSNTDRVGDSVAALLVTLRREFFVLI